MAAKCVTEFIADSAIKAFPAHGAGAAGGIVREMVKANKFRPHDLNLRVLAETCFGRSYETRLRRVSARSEWVADATETSADLSAFRGVLNQTVATVEADPASVVESVADQLVGIEPVEAGAPDSPIRTWRPAIAGTGAGTAGWTPVRDVLPGTPYPRPDFKGWYIQKPTIDKFGLIAYLTLEMVDANDVVGFLDAKAEVARLVKEEEDRRKLRLVYGIVQNYSRNGTTYGTYLASGDRVNKITDLNLANGPAELDRIDTVYRAMRHPVTGRRLTQTPTRMVTASLSQYQLKSALGVTTIQTTNGSVETTVENPFQFGGSVLADPLAEDLLVAEGGLTAAQARSLLIYGNTQAAFKWRQRESMAQFEVGPDDEVWGPPMEQDVVYATKTRCRGAGYVADPFQVLMAYNQSAT